MTDSFSSPSRRDRNMQVKRDRIFAAAASLFAERGYSGVTTLEISERADVAAGTLFRYAATKDELLLMVYNHELRRALAAGAALADKMQDPVEAIMAMVSPILRLAKLHADNLATYQSQLLFGAPSQKYRREGLQIIAGLEASIAQRLCDLAAARKLPQRPDAARLAAIAIFAVTHLAVSRASTGAHPDHDPEADLRLQIRQTVAGFFATLAESPSA